MSHLRQENNTKTLKYDPSTDVYKEIIQSESINKRLWIAYPNPSIAWILTDRIKTGGYKQRPVINCSCWFCNVYLGNIEE